MRFLVSLLSTILAVFIVASTATLEHRKPINHHDHGDDATQDERLPRIQIQVRSFPNWPSKDRYTGFKRDLNRRRHYRKSENVTKMKTVTTEASPSTMKQTKNHMIERTESLMLSSENEVSVSTTLVSTPNHMGEKSNDKSVLPTNDTPFTTTDGRNNENAHMNEPSNRISNKNLSNDELISLTRKAESALNQSEERSLTKTGTGLENINPESIDTSQSIKPNKNPESIDTSQSIKPNINPESIDTSQSIKPNILASQDVLAQLESSVLSESKEGTKSEDQDKGTDSSSEDQPSKMTTSIQGIVGWATSAWNFVTQGPLRKQAGSVQDYLAEDSSSGETNSAKVVELNLNTLEKRDQSKESHAGEPLAHLQKQVYDLESQAMTPSQENSLEYQLNTISTLDESILKKTNATELKRKHENPKSLKDQTKEENDEERPHRGMKVSHQQEKNSSRKNGQFSHKNSYISYDWKYDDNSDDYFMDSGNAFLNWFSGTNTETWSEADIKEKIEDVVSTSGSDDDIRVPGQKPILSTRSMSGITRSSSRPVAESDFNSSEVARLIDRYDTCEDCMFKVYSTSHQCKLYQDPAHEFDKWARYYSDLLKYGCSGQGVNHTERCCHSSDVTAQATFQEVNKLMKSLVGVLSHQCEKCPVDCIWSPWESWTACPATCNSRNQSRNRTRTMLVRDRFNGKPCHGTDIETGRCLDVIPEKGEWSPWSDWSACSSTCGGWKQRNRRCSVSASDCSCFEPCQGNTTQVEHCGDKTKCCHMRTWSSWGQWSDCVTVDVSTRSRRKTRWRTCEAEKAFTELPICPTPCLGQATDESTCCTTSVWGEWGPWSPCIGTENVVDLETGQQCGSGCKNRTRECHAGNCPNDTCYGDHVERIFCNLEPCCAPPSWTSWTDWSECSVTSGTGIKRRYRQCQPDSTKWRSPTCRTGGCWEHRHNHDKQDESCTGCHVCEMPTWGTWGSWSACQWRLPQPVRVRRRDCRRISGWDRNCQYLSCEGADHDTEHCQCDEPSWSSWSQWSPCDTSLSPPKRERSRICRPVTSPDYCSERECQGNSTENENCCAAPVWQEWSSWTSCQLVWDRAIRSRSRQCSFSAGCPPCQGDWSQKIDCILPTTPPPCDQGYWASWGSWSDCDCRNTREKSRTRARRPSIGRSSLCQPTAQTASEPCACQHCTEFCTGRADGKYPSNCTAGCEHYITCCQGQPLPEQCKGGQHYDAICQKCRRPPSSTCSGYFDFYRTSLTIPSIFPTSPEYKDKCRDG